MTERTNQPSRVSWSELLVLAGCLAGALVLALLVPTEPVRLDAGSPGDEPYLVDFFPAESNGIETFRWMGETGSLLLPVQRPGTYQVRLDLAAVEPAGRTLHATCGNQTTETLLGERTGNLTVWLTCRTPDEELRVDLATSVVRLPADGRPLGVSLRTVSLEALDAGDRLAFRLGAALTVFGALAGLWLALCSLVRSPSDGQIRSTNRHPERSRGMSSWNEIGRPRRLPTPDDLRSLDSARDDAKSGPHGQAWLWPRVGVAGITIGWLALVLTSPVSALSTVSGPGGVLALAGGMTALLLRTGRPWPARITALLGLASVLVLPPATLAVTLPGLWTAGDVAAVSLIPWLAAMIIGTAALIGSRQAAPLAVLGTGAGLASLFGPAAAKPLVARWSLTLEVPHWTDQASVLGLFFLLLVGLTAAVGLKVLAGDLARPRTLALLAGCVLAGLGLWRAEIMRFNGDEPHYYVTARSIGADGDLEHLDNYQEPAYRAATISPYGNIAVERDATADRYSGIGAAGPGSFHLVPPLDAGWEIDGLGPGIQPAGEPPPRVVAPDGAEERLPPLEPAENLVILLPAGCRVESIWLAGTTGDTDVTIRALDGSGRERWRVDQRIGIEPVPVTIPNEAGLCAGGPAAISLDSTGGAIIAQVFDRQAGLRIAPARQAGDVTTLLGLPRDRYAAPWTTTRVLLHNPGSETAIVTLRAMGPSDLALWTVTVGLPAGASHEEVIDVLGAEAVRVTSNQPIVVSGTGQVFPDSAAYELPAGQWLTEWYAPVEAASGRDAGTWLTVANPLPEPAALRLVDGARFESFELCGFCATTHFFPASEERRWIEIRSVQGTPLLAGAVGFEERTASLHFDLGLPLLAALPARWGPPMLTLIVPWLAAVGLAAGVAALLGRIGVGPRVAFAAGLGSVLLAPVSPYTVRLYTEIPAACLLIWGLYCWDRGRSDGRYLAVSGAIAAGLPFLHGRLTPLALVLLGLCLWQVWKQAHANGKIGKIAWRWWGLSGLAITLLGISVLFLTSRFAVALTERGIEDYFAVAWVPNNFAGVLLDRGSGLLPFAPWVLLGLAAPRPLLPLQRAGLLLFLTNLTVVMLRVNGWQTWGAPARYLLPAVPLLLLLSVPGALRLWGVWWGRAVVGAALVWSLGLSLLLHWLPLSGYVRGSRYLIDEALGGLLGWSPVAVFPQVKPSEGWPWLGVVLLGLVVAALSWVGLSTVLVRHRACYSERGEESQPG